MDTLITFILIITGLSIIAILAELMEWGEGSD